MARPIHCPLTRNTCTECALYRGRHHYLNFSKQDQGCCTDEPKGLRDLDLRALERLAEPWAGKYRQGESEPDIRLKVVDMETDATRICNFDDAKTWDWSNPLTLRLIDGRHVNSLDRLIEILKYKMEKGCEEVEIYEGPRFMLLAGG